jgi:hypothetical protein
VARVAVVECGEIGLAFAAAACDAGHDVGRCARPARGALVLERDDGSEVRFDRPAVDRAAAGGPAEAIGALRSARHPGSLMHAYRA